MSFNAETYIALTAAFVALCSLGVTIFQGRQNYKHNKLSVKPLLTTSDYTHTEEKYSIITYKLINSGVGPAIIKNFILMLGEKELSCNNTNKYEKELKNLFPNCWSIHVGSYVPGGVIRADEVYTLISVKYEPQKQNVDFAKQLNLVIEYQSIYKDENFTYDSRLDRQYHGQE